MTIKCGKCKFILKQSNFLSNFL